MLSHAHIVAHYNNGVRLGLEVNTSVPEDQEGREMWLVGNQGTLYCSTRLQSVVFYNGSNLQRAAVKCVNSDGIVDQHRAFVECIRCGNPPYPDGKTARVALKTCIAAQLSLVEGRPVAWDGL